MKRDATHMDLRRGRRKSKIVLWAAAAALLSTGCTSIWNAGDLAVWVKDQAVKEGCRRETIEQEEWYRKTDSGNVWYGTCRDGGNNPMSFGINVDSVWKPSTE